MIALHFSQYLSHSLSYSTQSIQSEREKELEVVRIETCDKDDILIEIKFFSSCSLLTREVRFIDEIIIIIIIY
jgi:hypothetical protein